MDAMDCNPPQESEDEQVHCGGVDGGVDWIELPQEPEIRIVDVECTSIDSGDETVKKGFVVLTKTVAEWSKEDIEDPSSPVWQYAIELTKRMRKQEAEELNQKSQVKQWQDAVDNAIRIVISNVIKMMSKANVRTQSNLSGDIKKRINTRKKIELGAVQNTVESYRAHYQWLKRLEERLSETKEVPLWLS
jgi:hypothetical protein